VSLASRKAEQDALEQRIADLTAARDRFELARALRDAGVAAYPSMTAKDLVEDPQLATRRFFERLPHAEVGRRVHSGIPHRLRRRGNGVRSAAPRLGEHTEAVLSKVLGLSAGEIADLRDAKVLF
jgi:benzylsuccinate CoA-transferase BbsF subunit